jgi:class 3 adenylate cyclase
MQPKDELGEIACAFDKLSDDLHATRDRRTELEQALAQRNAEVESQRRISESLLLNILPATVAEEFRCKGAVEPKYLEDVTIVFTDFVGFSSSAEKLAAEDLVQMLHEYFSAFDEITARYGLEKLKTIGDSYMCAGGLPERNPSHPVDAVMAAMEIVRTVTERRGIDSQHNLAIRVGIHTGHLIAGMVGKQKFAYDIWGESVNYASRVESGGEPNRIALSGQTFTRIKDFFECEKRTKMHSKVSHKMELYFVNGFLPTLTDDSRQVPPPAFLRRYRSYFQKDPPSFPSRHAKRQSGDMQLGKNERGINGTPVRWPASGE